MTKIILKSIGTTLVAIAILFVMAFSLLSLVFPATMTRTCASLGFYSSAARYASMEYERSGSVEKLAEAMEYALFDENDELVEEYGDLLVAHSDFFRFCSEDKVGVADYQQYVYGSLACAKYDLGQKTEAIDLVFHINADSFAPNNAIIYLSLSAIEANDKETCGEILNRLETFTVEGEDAIDLENVKNLLKEITNE